MIRYRVKMFFDVFVEDTEFAELYASMKAQKISKKIPNSWVEEVKIFPHGSERTWDGEFRKEIINENNQD
ncbi:MAG: hypothetical protein QQN55_08340 [Nitrosopumilus sp.]